ncbi:MULTISPECIES: AtpZ/AtpI family protein [Rhizobium/Agrobacterium group]|uniref:AtpZ/AtpI family protein n=1 Tax=Rhizobium/Agrobacterium group TaxID=227290 RepID=UPI000B3FF161|nr:MULTISPECIES: AtpZ/AtpI family protein [Rhizobium/Agrobacterium group]MCF1484571.1 F0F1 ATP synthase assembly protein [Allorhizobium ampelinum]NSZ41795.1 F0F1 ATP synthase assembly protein [Agrobacterium vitis]NTA25504.1 F0F1 ATP synthase assembly protein [Allorhizobium ampelinum]OVE96838.1 F0F1 ATP synthase assembly protein [Allorhizobium ampelinum]
MDDQERELERRRSHLGAKLAAKDLRTGEEAAQDERAQASRNGYAQAMKLSSEFLSAIIVGIILGFLIDHFAGTSPWGLIVLLLLGFCAGVLNVLRAAGKVASPHPADRSSDGKGK